MRTIKLSKWAKENCYTYRHAFGLFQAGKIENSRKLPTGAIVVDIFEESIKQDYVVVYARVSSSENKDNLETQSKRLNDFCAANGWVVKESIKECASGLNDSRPKLIKLLTEQKATKIVIEHKDRLTRFGFNYIKTLLPNCNIVIINEANEGEEDLMEDFVSLITSFCARIYGKRRSKRVTEKIINNLNKKEEEQSDD